jgi:hypothetical protein
MFPSKYIKAVDLNDTDWTLTMDRVELEKVGEPGEEEEKPALYFRKTKKPLLLNKTNALTIAALHGPDTDGWAGKKITLFATKVQAFGAIHDAVRIRDTIPPEPKKQSGNGQTEVLFE